MPGPSDICSLREKSLTLWASLNQGSRPDPLHPGVRGQTGPGPAPGAPERSMLSPQTEAAAPEWCRQCHGGRGRLCPGLGRMEACCCCSLGTLPEGRPTLLETHIRGNRGEVGPTGRGVQSPYPQPLQSRWFRQLHFLCTGTGELLGLEGPGKLGRDGTYARQGASHRGG